MFRSSKTYLLSILLVPVVLLIACSQNPKPIHLSSDECAHCRMMITDPRFASQIVTAKGKAVKFDAIECMAQYYSANGDNLPEARLWVSDFNNPGTWVEAGEAIFIKSEVIQSPMGKSLLALPSGRAAEKHLNEHPGRKLTWEEVRRQNPVGSESMDHL